MEIFHYNQPDEVYGYSANQVFWAPAMSLADCKSIDTTSRCNTYDGATICYQIEQCLNDKLRKSKSTSQSPNGRYIDSRNMQFTTFLHTATMSVAIVSILYYGAKEVFSLPATAAATISAAAK
jgi:hypothetical protein